MYTWFEDNSLPSTEYWTVYNVQYIHSSYKIIKSWSKLINPLRRRVQTVGCITAGLPATNITPFGTQTENIKRMNSCGFKVLDRRNFKFIRKPPVWDEDPSLCFLNCQGLTGKYRFHSWFAKTRFFRVQVLMKPEVFKSLRISLLCYESHIFHAFPMPMRSSALSLAYRMHLLYKSRAYLDCLLHISLHIIVNLK